MNLSSIVSKASEKLNSGFKKTFTYSSAILFLGTTNLACTSAKNTTTYQGEEKKTVLVEDVKNLSSYDDKRIEFSAIPISSDLTGNEFNLRLEVKDENNNTLYHVLAKEDVNASNRDLIKEINYLLSSKDKDREGIIQYNKSNPSWDKDIKVTVSGIYNQFPKTNRSFYESGKLELETITLLNERYFTDPEQSAIYKENPDNLFSDKQVYVRVHYPAYIHPRWDWDGDGIPDWWKSRYKNFRWNTRWNDADGDGLSNLTEWRIGTDPYNSDTDFDGLSDYYELRVGLNPKCNDSDHDGISDYYDNYPRWNNDIIIVTTPFLFWNHHWTNFYFHWDMWGYNHWYYHKHFHPKKDFFRDAYTKHRNRNRSKLRDNDGYRKYKLKKRKNLVKRSGLNREERKKFGDFKLDNYKKRVAREKRKLYEKPIVKDRIKRNKEIRKGTYDFKRKSDNSKIRRYRSDKKSDLERRIENRRYTKPHIKRDTKVRKRVDKTRTYKPKIYIPRRDKTNTKEIYRAPKKTYTPRTNKTYTPRTRSFGNVRKSTPNRTRSSSPKSRPPSKSSKSGKRSRR